jgi:hypothetical protein
MLPGGLGFLPEWRVTGAEVLGLDFSGTSSVRPLQSVEAFLMLAASLAWLYAISQLSLNQNGRKWVLLGIALLGLFFGLLAIGGVHYNWNYPGSALVEPFTFFAAPGQMGALLLLLGVFSFCYGMESLTHRSPYYLVGIPVSALCFTALIYGKHFTELLFFFLGLGLYCAPRIWSAEVKKWQKLAIGLPLYSVLIVALTADGGLADLISRMKLSVKHWQMFIEMPLTGIGLGNYATLAPNYCEVWQANTEMAYPNDFMLAALAMGILGALGFMMMLFGIVIKLDLPKLCRVGSLRLSVFLAALIYLWFGFSGEPRHSLALIYLVLLVVVLALPLGYSKEGGLPPRIWKVCGGLFLFVGSIWMLGSLTGLPVHSGLILEKNKQYLGKAQAEADIDQAIRALDRLVKIDPMNWYWYHERAKLLLKIRERDQAETDFKRALLVEPHLVSPAYEQGKAWFGHLGSEAEFAWAEALRRAGPDAPAFFGRLVKQGKDKSYQAPVLLRLSRMDTKYAVIYLELVEKARFLEELNRYREADPELAQFNRNQRTRILLRWVRSGQFIEPGRYLEQYASSLNLAWYLQAYVFQNEGRFKEALELLRAGLAAPSLPEVEDDPASMAFLEREFAGKPRNYEVGIQILSALLKQADLSGGLRLVNKLLENDDAPRELFYWQSELYLQSGNLVESWLSLEAYAQRVLNL